MTWRALAGMLLFCAFSVGGAASHAQTRGQDPDDDGPVSTERIREGLRRPELQIPELPPEPLTFRSEVEVRLETALDVIRRELQEEARGRRTYPTRTGIDLLPALMSLVSNIKDIRYRHSEADARRRVAEELEAFCAAHDCSQFEPEPVTEGVLPTR